MGYFIFLLPEKFVLIYDNFQATSCHYLLTLTPTILSAAAINIQLTFFFSIPVIIPPDFNIHIVASANTLVSRLIKFPDSSHQ